MKRKIIKNRAAWVHALESGEYHHIRDVHHADDGFCALGVGIDSVLKGEWVYHVSPAYSFEYSFRSKNFKKHNYKTPTIELFSNVDLPLDYAETITHLNDSTDSYKTVIVALKEWFGDDYDNMVE